MALPLLTSTPDTPGPLLAQLLAIGTTVAAAIGAAVLQILKAEEVAPAASDDDTDKPSKKEKKANKGKGGKGKGKGKSDKKAKVTEMTEVGLLPALRVCNRPPPPSASPHPPSTSPHRPLFLVVPWLPPRRRHALTTSLRHDADD